MEPSSQRPRKKVSRLERPTPNSPLELKFSKRKRKRSEITS
jgi:hypothetical protein